MTWVKLKKFYILKIQLLECLGHTHIYLFNIYFSMIIRETAGHLNCKTFQREVSAGRKSRLLMKACCSVATLYLKTLYHAINCSMPGFPVLHHLPEFAQVHVHCTGDAIQPSHPLLSPSAFLAYESFPVSRLFASGAQNIGASAEYSAEYSGLVSFRIDWFDLLGV